MKKLLLLLTVLFAAIGAKADDIVLHVLLSDGQVVAINLNEEPRTTYKDGYLVITTTKNTVTYPLEKAYEGGVHLFWLGRATKLDACRGCDYHGYVYHQSV